MEDCTKIVFDAFEARGGSRYGKEAVTQTQHAEQCAALAVDAGVSDTLVAAALLHDIGHLLPPSPNDESEDEMSSSKKAARGLDDRHEARGYEFLRVHFVEDVAAPVRLHVSAKRYLCTVEPEYREQLSPTSLQSFHDQGGVMDPDELARFREQPCFREALQLRRWDDLAKDPTKRCASVMSYAAVLRTCLVESK